MRLSHSYLSELRFRVFSTFVGWLDGTFPQCKILTVRAMTTMRSWFPYLYIRSGYQWGHWIKTERAECCLCLGRSAAGTIFMLMLYLPVREDQKLYPELSCKSKHNWYMLTNFDVAFDLCNHCIAKTYWREVYWWFVLVGMRPPWICWCAGPPVKPPRHDVTFFFLHFRIESGWSTRPSKSVISFPRCQP